MEERGREPGLDATRPVESFAETVRRVFVEPAGFFGGITGEARPWPPMVFALICGVVAAALGLAVELLVPVELGVFGGGASGLPPGFSGQVGGAALAGLLLAFIVFLPLSVVLGLYVGSLIYQLLIMLIVGRENAGYWATFKIYAYTSVVALLSWLPVVGVLAALYGYYLVFVGVREAHSATPARAAIMAAIPLAFFVGSFVVGLLTTFSGV